MPREGATVAVQGFGNVGSSTALHLHELGCKVPAVVDVYGGVFNGDGINIPELYAYARETGTVKDFPGCEAITTRTCCPSTVTCWSRPLWRADHGPQRRRRQGEGHRRRANGPTTPEADRILAERGIVVVPDILANAGGVTVSYFEWGAGPAVPVLGRGRDQRPPGADHGARLQRGVADGPGEGRLASSVSPHACGAAGARRHPDPGYLPLGSACFCSEGGCENRTPLWLADRYPPGRPPSASFRLPQAPHGNPAGPIITRHLPYTGLLDSVSFWYYLGMKPGR